ncbi:alpha/beta hydrolase [Cryobacterium sp. CG_9.6]|uniref:alpha/beta fold hydrolase n=1 Tax=Cryobacterium sp. CG_9.6 TaxID=2760710 RepID=UPI00247502CE|nr:alpha/beta hydrolase [Cryobacterium sp. CG_9.6]MDH6236759.1 pimeloyl-ACP methyl ester carboxylesterase [Cryobacterium sp. CG_9.6]
MFTQEVPTWFTTALEAIPEHHTIVVDGVVIAYQAWGSTDGDPVVLVHGGAAHAGWWDHIAPNLTARHRIIALHLSGHGESGHRHTYSLSQWASEVMAVAASESSTPPILLGHSLGGLIALTAAADAAHAIRGTLAIDSSITPQSEERWSHLPRINRREATIYPDRATILGRYRTLPEDDATLSYIRDYVAAGSIVQVEGGWRWRFDPAIFETAPWWNPDDLLSIQGDVALLLGRRGAGDSDIADWVQARFGDRIPVSVVEDSGHHVMLDQPLALTEELQKLVARWSEPEPAE